MERSTRNYQRRREQQHHERMLPSSEDMEAMAFDLGTNHHPLMLLPGSTASPSTDINLGDGGSGSGSNSDGGGKNNGTGSIVKDDDLNSIQQNHHVHYHHHHFHKIRHQDEGKGNSNCLLELKNEEQNNIQQSSEQDVYPIVKEEEEVNGKEKNNMKTEEGERIMEGANVDDSNISQSQPNALFPSPPSSSSSSSPYQPVHHLRVQSGVTWLYGNENINEKDDKMANTILGAPVAAKTNHGLQTTNSSSSSSSSSPPPKILTGSSTTSTFIPIDDGLQNYMKHQTSGNQFLKNYQLQLKMYEQEVEDEETNQFLEGRSSSRMCHNAGNTTTTTSSSSAVTTNARPVFSSYNHMHNVDDTVGDDDVTEEADEKMIDEVYLANLPSKFQRLPDSRDTYENHLTSSLINKINATDSRKSIEMEMRSNAANASDRSDVTVIPVTPSLIHRRHPHLYHHHRRVKTAVTANGSFIIDVEEEMADGNDHPNHVDGTTTTTNNTSSQAKEQHHDSGAFFDVTQPVVLGLREMANVLRRSDAQVQIDEERLERIRYMHDRFSQGCEFSFNYNVLLLVASLLAGLGLASDGSATIIASMLISPIMGPVVGIAYGATIQDWKLCRKALKTELISLAICILSGTIVALCSGWSQLGHTWPTSEMKTRSNWQNFLVALPVAFFSGLGVAVGLLDDQTSSLVGVAISASLLPPAVNSGILWVAYWFQEQEWIGSGGTLLPAPIQDEQDYYFTGQERDIELWNGNGNIDDDDYIRSKRDFRLGGTLSLMLTLSNIVLIIMSSMFMFRLKERLPVQKNIFWNDLGIARKIYQNLAVIPKNREDMNGDDKYSSSESTGASNRQLHIAKPSIHERRDDKLQV